MVENRDRWRVVFVLAFVALAHAAIPACFPRYEYIVLGPYNADVIRHDRWTGDNDHMWIVDRGPDNLTPPLPLPFR